MWYDDQADLQEFECFLYGQVHYPMTEEYLASNTLNESTNKNRTENTNNGYQNQATFEVPGNLRRTHVTYPRSNFCDPVNYAPEISVNNFVVLPSSSREVYNERSFKNRKAKKRYRAAMHRRNKRYIKMFEGTRSLHLLKEKNVNCETIISKQKETVIPKQNEAIIPKQNEAIIPKQNEAIIPEQDKVIYVEELSSDCEIIDAAIVVSSSDEGVSEVKDDASNNNNCEPTVLNSVEDADASKPVLKEIKEGDDVIFVETKQAEVIDISCDDSQSATLSGNDPNNSVTPENWNKQISNFAAINSNRPDTPASSVNDFLETSFSDSNDIPCSNRRVLCENESNSSTSDKENSSTSFAFVQHEFAEHSQDNMLELNLDSFTDYIGSVNTTLKVQESEILNECHSGNSIQQINNTTNQDKHSSDSSSESEYEDNKVAVIESKIKVEKTTKAKDETSDGCLVIKETKNKSYLLPDLSPISSDVESDGKNKSSISEPTPLKKKMSQSSNKPAEKRRSDDLRELIKAKKMKDKQNESIQTPRLLNVDKDLVELINVRDDAKETPTQESMEGSSQKPVRFKDYWSDDMMKFYSDSWGHETFSLEAAQKNMSDLPEKWKILPVDCSYIRLRPKGPLCRRCNDYGHKALKCKKPLKPIKCSTCGERGHNFQRCPKSLCTSCGTGNYSVISCCSRCANRRSIRCRLCFQYGHFNTNCPDLWRRYHLTTQPGPLKQPTNHNFKPIEDRWCSICASQGHFDFECHIDTGMHLANNPRIYYYDDVYDSVRKETPSKSNKSFTLQKSSGNKSYSNVRPLINTKIENPRSSHSNTITSNCSQQSSLFQSIPSLASLPYRQGKNVHEKSTETRFIPSESDHYVDNNPLPTTSMPLSNLSQPQPTIVFINLNKENGSCLNSVLGKRFLDKLRRTFNLKIDITKSHVQGEGFECTIEGLKDAHLKTVKLKILNYVCKQKLFVLENAFQCNIFNLNRLEVYVASLDNPYVNWLFQAHSLYSKIETTQSLILNVKSVNKKAKLEKQLKRCLRSLNAVLIGKLFVVDGNRHMENLKQAKRNQKNGTLYKSLLFSFEHVFNNANYLDIPYRALIKRLPIGKDTVAEMRELRDTGIECCEKNNLLKLLKKIQVNYNLMVQSGYQPEGVNHFTNVIDKVERCCST